MKQTLAEAIRVPCVTAVVTEESREIDYRRGSEAAKRGGRRLLEMSDHWLKGYDECQKTH